MALVDHLPHISDTTKHVGDLLSVGALIGVLVQALPALTALLTCIWVSVRLYEGILSIKERRLAIKLKERELAGE